MRKQAGAWVKYNPKKIIAVEDYDLWGASGVITKEILGVFLTKEIPSVANKILMVRRSATKGI
jgi:hypothetical protein